MSPRWSSRLATAVKASLLCLAPFLFGTSALAGDKRPNVVLLVWDTTRADHLSLYGHERETTPNLDRIAKDGVVFTNGQTSGYWTLPAAASLFTGLFAHNHLVDFAHFRTKDYSLEVPDAAVTLAEAFQAAGYRTGMFNASKIITDNDSYKQGFDEFQFVGEGRLAGEALKFAQAEDERPFFMVMWYLTPHAPYTPQAPFDKWVREDVPPVNIEGCNKRTGMPEGHVSQCDVNQGVVTLTDDQWDQLSRLYDGEILRNDTQLGKFWDQLAAAGLTKDLVFAFTSDHGEAFNDHELERAWHNFPYDNNQSVPLVVRYPEGLKPARVDTAVRTMDVYPTLLELVKADVPQGLNASSLIPVATGKETAHRVNVGGNHGGMQWYFDGRHKLIYVSRDQAHPFANPQLFDQNTDPHEDNSLAKSQPDLAKKVHTAALDFFKSTQLGVGEGDGVNAEQLDLLREMGYIE